MALSIWNHLKQMGMRPQTRVRASRANRQPIFTPSNGSILGVQDKQRPPNDKWSYKLWSRTGALGGPSCSVHSRDSGGCCDPVCSGLPLLMQPCIADWGPAQLPALSLQGGPSPGSRLLNLETRKSRLPVRHSPVLCLLSFSSMTNPRAVDCLSSCLGLV